MSRFLPIVNPHSHPLSLDSGNSVKQFIKSAAKDFGRTAIGITDHGTIGAIIEAHEYTKELKKKENLDITIIPGVELYLLPDDDSGAAYYHVTVHFQDFPAYLEACKLSKPSYDRAVNKGGELKALTTWQELEGLSGRVTLFSSCMVGAVQQPFIRGHKDVSEKNFLRLKAIAGPGRFFAEIFPYEVSKDWNGKTKQFVPKAPTECCPSGKFQVDCNEWIFHLAQKHGVPTVVSEDAHYAHEEDKFIQDCRLNKNGKGTWKMSDANCLHQSDWLFNELSRLHPAHITEKTFNEMIDNSYAMLGNFKNFEPKFKPSLPKVIVENRELTSDDELVSHVLGLIVKKNRIDLRDPVYAARIDKELKQLAYNGKVNILPYFLVLNTIIDFCEENEVLVGPGRGSAAGCLLSYALGIVSTDPIIEDLSFERFFDVTRVEEGLADIDTDFSDRTKVVDFIKSFWGDKFAYLGIATTFKTKSALKDIDRFLNGEVRKVTEEVCKKIPGSPQGSTEEEFLRGFTDADGNYQTGELENNEALRDYLNEHPKAAEFLFKMVGIVRQMGRHAAGVLIADKPIHEFIPIMQVSKEPTTQLLPKWVEKCGGIKYDILGVNTLEDIRICLKHIKQRHGISIDPWKIKDDPDFWEAAINNPVTVFQLHTATVREGLQTMRPKNVQEAAILTSVFRPGTMDAKSDEDPTKNMSDIFLERWTGKRAVKMIHPDLEPILGPTKGIVVYQEQIMRIVHELGGLTMPETNKLRKAISKKEGDDLKKLLQKVKEWLIIGKGWNEAQAESIVSQMKASGRYCFNKSHAVAYCYIARACAYLKHYYPIEWWTAVLSNSSDEDLQANWQHNASITLPPNINTSAAQFSILPSEQILSPLSLVKGVAAAVMSELLEKRPFASLEDMLRKVDRRIIHKGVMLKLILSGTLNQFFPTDAGDVEKMQIFLNTKAIIEGSSSPETVPDEYRNLTPLKNFLIKKSVFKVYTEHLASIAILKLEAMGIASRVTEGANSWVVNVKNDYYGNGRRSIVSLSRLGEFIESDKAHRFAVIAYITKTEEKPYADNKKNRLIVNAEIDNKSFEFIKWPGWKQNTHGINEDVEDSVCVLVLSKREGSDEGIFIDELTVIENLNFLKEKKDVEQKPKSKRTKKKTGSSAEHSESGPE